MDYTIPLVVLACYLLHLFHQWVSRKPTVGALVVAELDAGPEAGPEVVSTRVARQVAYEFKAEFGELRYNNANRCIAGDWVRKRFRAMDMRYVDIVRHMDVCVELCLTPTVHSVGASELARTPEVRARRALVAPPK